MLWKYTFGSNVTIWWITLLKKIFALYNNNTNIGIWYFFVILDLKNCLKICIVVDYNVYINELILQFLYIYYINKCIINKCKTLSLDKVLSNCTKVAALNINIACREIISN